VNSRLRIFFFGAARTVTGSMHVIEAAGKRVLLDCGLYQGRRKEAEEKNRFLPFDASGIDYMVLSHAHIDHSGNIPSLVKQGYQGPIYTTHATRDLCTAMLRDSGRIHERDADYYNRRIRGRTEPKIQPLYTEEDAVAAMGNFVGVNYEAPMMLAPGIRLELRDAGHVLGSAITILDIETNSEEKRICFTGDLGRPDTPLLRDPKLAEIVNRTVERGGKVLIPAFALERAQTVLYLLHRLLIEKKIPVIPIYIDSPLTINITEIFKLHPEYFDVDARTFWEDVDPFGFRTMRYISEVSDSKALNYEEEPSIIIAGSGMCDAGRIVHHLRNNLEDERNTVLIVGFQAKSTLGRRLIEHQPEVRIFGVDVLVDAEIVDIRAFSGHADRDGLIGFAGGCNPAPDNIFLVHGEEPQALALAQRLQENGCAQVAVPHPGEFHDV
jgi:metallo-beta-lactamase family protein